jgi:hypothetical protein
MADSDWLFEADDRDYSEMDLDNSHFITPQKILLDGALRYISGHLASPEADSECFGCTELWVQQWLKAM